MKPIKLKELLRTAKGPATQRIVIDEGLWFDVPLFEGVVKDVDEALGERIISNWQVETDGTRLIVSSNPPLQDLQECRPSKIAHTRLMMLMITQSSYLMHASRFERGKQKMGK